MCLWQRHVSKIAKTSALPCHQALLASSDACRTGRPYTLARACSSDNFLVKLQNFEISNHTLWDCKSFASKKNDLSTNDFNSSLAKESFMLDRGSRVDTESMS